MGARLFLQTFRGTVTLAKLRPLPNLLSALGVAVSVALIVSLLSIGQGAHSAVEQQVATMGDNVAVIMPGSQRVSGLHLAQGTAVTLRISDAEAIRRAIAMVKDVCWGRRDPTQVVHHHHNWRLPVVGVNPGCFAVRQWALTSGRFFTEAEMAEQATVAVLGQTAAQRLFDDEDPVGATIVIKRVPFRVVGVLSPKGSAPAGSDQDDVIFLPFSTAQRKVHGARFYDWVEAISVSTHRREDLPTLAREVTAVLREQHRLADGEPSDFSVRTQLDLAMVYEGASRTLLQFLLVVGGSALLVGGVGIMNIILVSVSQRTREIGVRMAVGAKRRHILGQFLIEAIILSVAGGLAGIVLGIAAAHAATALAGWPTIISPHTVAMALAVSLAVGIAAGRYPASKAARLTPLEALRHE